MTPTVWLAMLVAPLSAQNYSWQLYNGHWYTLTQTHDTWLAARAEAQTIAGGDLACIGDAAENQWILGNLLHGQEEVHIGLYQPTGTYWAWVNGDPVTYLSWAPTEPQGYPGEDYVDMDGSSGTDPGMWRDAGSNSVISFLGVIETAINPGIMVLSAPVPGSAGTLNSILVSNAFSGATIFLAYGTSQGSTSVPGCGSLTIQVATPAVRSGQANSFGEAVFLAYVPTTASGKTFYLQGVDVQACQISNLVAYTFP